MPYLEFISIKDIKSSAPSSSSSTFDSSALFECQIEAHQTLPNTKTILLGFTNHNGNGCVEGVEMYLHNKFALLANSLEFDGAGFAFLEKVRECYCRERFVKLIPPPHFSPEKDPHDQCQEQSYNGTFKTPNNSSPAL